MSVVLTPSGTRGTAMPRLPGPLVRFLTSVIFSIFRNRRFMGFRVLMLTTVGARTGQPRRTVLGYFADPDDPSAWIIVGAAAGAARHPAWYFNLGKHPDQVWIEIGNRKIQVRPETLTGDARSAAWQRVVEEAPSYANYPVRTDREIPVIRLKAA